MSQRQTPPGAPPGPVTAPDLPDLVVRGRRVVLADGVRPAAVHVRGGRILAVAGYDSAPAGCPVEDAGDLVLMAGLVDTHVHVNEPGRTEWEGFATATRAAACGGVTTLVDMPLNSIPPTTTAAGLREKVASMLGKLHVDVGLCGGLVPQSVPVLHEIAAEGALAFKCFLAESGVDEFPHVGEDDLRAGMRRLAELGASLLCHAELPGPLLRAAAAALEDEDPRRYATYLRSRPPEAEEEAVALVARLSRELGTRAHIVHLSAAEALQTVRKARDAGAPLSAETCPHYLSFAAEDIPDGATEFKCAPPIRQARNRDRLWDALREGVIDQVVTDHSPSSPELKCAGSGDFMRAWGGISSLQLGLPAVWTGARQRGLGLVELSRWMSATPAALVGLAGRKGRIAPGLDADLVIWNPDADLPVDPARLEHRHPISPYKGRTLQGVVERTILRGKTIYDRAAGRDDRRAGGSDRRADQRSGQLSPPSGVWLRGGN